MSEAGTSDHQRSFAVVTGGSNGIGFELTRRQFLANGFDVLIAAQHEARLRSRKSAFRRWWHRDLLGR